MKNVSIKIVMLMVLMALLSGRIGLGETIIRNCNNRDVYNCTENAGTGGTIIRNCNNREDLEAFTGVPTSGIVIEQLEYILNYKDLDITEVIVVCRTTEEHAMDIFLKGLRDPYFSEWLNFQEILSSFGVSREMILSSTALVLEMRRGRWIYPYYNCCFPYYQGSEIYYTIISLVPCTLMVDTEGILSETIQ